MRKHPFGQKPTSVPKSQFPHLQNRDKGPSSQAGQAESPEEQERDPVQPWPAELHHGPFWRLSSLSLRWMQRMLDPNPPPSPVLPGDSMPRGPQSFPGIPSSRGSDHTLRPHLQASPGVGLMVVLGVSEAGRGNKAGLCPGEREKTAQDSPLQVSRLWRYQDQAGRLQL